MSSFDNPEHPAFARPSRTRKPIQIIAALFAIAALISMLSSPARAASVTWDPLTSGTGSDGAGTWNVVTTNTNWANGTDQAWSNSDATDIAVIGNGSGAGGAITIGTTIDLGGITFNPVTSGSYTLSGGTLSFSGAAPAITANTNAMFSGNTLTSGGASPLSLNVAAGQSLTLSTTTWSGTSGFSKDGAGTVTIPNGSGNGAGTDRFSISNTGGGAFSMDNGTFNVASTYFVMGQVGTAPAIYNQTGGVFNWTDEGGGFVFGNGAQAGSITVSGGTFNQVTGASPWYIGFDEAGTVNVSGTGTVNVRGNLLVGVNATGAVNLSGTGVLTAINQLQMGDSKTGTWTQSGGTFTSTYAGTDYIGYNSGTVDSWTQTGGTSTFVNTLVMGYGAGTSGSLSLSGGSFSSPGQFFQIGVSTSGTSVWTQSGGTASFGEVIIGNNGTGTAAITGGTFTSTASGLYVGVGAGSGGSTSDTLTVSGSGVVNANAGLIVGFSGTGGTVNLNGGTINAASVSHNGGTLGVLNFNGGTLQPESSGFTMTGVTANVLAGGAIINTGTFSPTISQAFVTGAANDGGLTVLGSGTLTLATAAGANTYNGGTTVSGCTLSLSGNGGPSGIINGALTINSGGTVIAGSWALGFGSGSGNSVNSITINSGTLNFTNTGAGGGINAPNITMTGGAITDSSLPFQWYNSLTNTPTLTTNASTVTSVISSGIQFYGITNLTFSVASGTAPGGVDLIESGVMSDFTGTAGITKTGAGMMELTATNTYTGATSVSGGTLQIGNGSTGSVSSSSALSATNGATLAFDEANGSNISSNIADGGIVAGAEGLGISDTLSGVISGTGGFTQSGAGTTTLTAINTYSGGTTVNGGTLTLGSTPGGAPGIISGTLTINSGGTVNVTNNVAEWALGFGSTASTAVSSIAINSGTLNFTGANDTGGTVATSISLTGAAITGSTFQLYPALTSTPAFTSNASSVTSIISAPIDVRSGITSITFNVASGSTSSGIDLLDSGAIINAGGGNPNIIKTGAGTLEFTGANTDAGATEIYQGTLQIGNGGTSGSLSSSSAISGSAGATLVYDLSSSGTITNSITGGLGVTQAGGGTLTLVAASSGYSGATTVTNGTLIADSTLSGNAAVRGGTLIVAGSLSGNASVTSGTLINSTEIGGNVNVAGGSVGGAGTFAGNVVVGTGSGGPGSSIISPSIGVATPANTNILNVKNLTLNSDAAFEFALNSTTGNSDGIAVSGTLTLGGSLIGTDVGNTLLPTDGSVTFIIASYSTLNGTFAGIPEDGLVQIGRNWFSVDYNFDDTDQIVLSSAVPEPGTWATMLCGFAMLIGFQRRRAKSRGSVV